jgi:replication factor C subunit 2/4
VISASSRSAGGASEFLPWVEKHRPRTLDDVVGNTDAIDRLRVIAMHGNMPNLLIAGPPGTFS